MNCLKHIPLNNAYNVRDLGGYPTQDGHFTRWNMLYRSDALAALDEADWQILKDRNIRTIIDLRSTSEAAASPIHVPEYMVYCQFSLMNTLDVRPQSMSREAIIESMKLDYVKTLFGNMECGAQILTTILERMDAGAVLFLCSAGKDRTGIVAALSLYLCNVIREDIVADYIVSSTYNTNGINKKIANLPPEIMKMVPDMELLKDCFSSKSETIIKLLDAFDAQDIRGKLDEAGFAREKQEMFREKMME